MKDNPSVVVRSTHVIVVTEVMIQILERVVFLIIIEKKMGSLSNGSYNSCSYFDDTSDRDETQLLIFC